jgi:chemotaxis protein histidine kinase CheA
MGRSRAAKRRAQRMRRRLKNAEAAATMSCVRVVLAGMQSPYKGPTSGCDSRHVHHGSPENLALITEICRPVETIKGTTGFLGYKRLEKLAHASENSLCLLRHGAIRGRSIPRDYAHRPNKQRLLN